MSKAIKALDQNPANKKKNRVQGTGAGTLGNSSQSSQQILNETTVSTVKKQVTLHPLEQMLGTTVKHSSGTTVSPTTFSEANGVIGLYFAAHWCPPCKMLTSQLALLYDELSKGEHRFEVIYVSFDYSEESFTQYFSNMPWHAIDFKDTDKREEMTEQFSITRIPVLIFLDANTCEVISRDGREIITLDPTGTLFPWRSHLQEVATVSLVTPEVEMSQTPEVAIPKSQLLSSKPSDQDNKLVEDVPAVADT